MSDTGGMNYPNWTEDQWSRIRKIVADGAQKTRIAAQFLPLFGPVDRSVVAVPNLLLGVNGVPPAAGAMAANRFAVDSAPETFLATISVQIPLGTHEVADPELLAASVGFRRAALTVARIEDALIFNGQPLRGLAPVPLFPGGFLAGIPPVFTVTGGYRQPGLVPAGARPGLPPLIRNLVPRESVPVLLPDPGRTMADMADWGTRLVAGISQAIGALEGDGHSGPFACFLSESAFNAVHTPAPSLVLPRDRILPLLGGDYLRRSNTIPDGYGVLVALGGEPVEIVVATDIDVKFLQRTAEPKYLFRVSERITLRVKEWNAIAVLHPQASPSDERKPIYAAIRK